MRISKIFFEASGLPLRSPYTSDSNIRAARENRMCVYWRQDGANLLLT